MILVCDNLNTHTRGAFYEAFDPATARSVGLCLRLIPGSVKQPQVIAYLRELKRHLKGRRAILLWDRLPAHRGGQVGRYVERNADWLTVEWFPPYAPELNPVEYLWSHLSRTDMANFVGENLAAVRRGPPVRPRRQSEPGPRPRVPPAQWLVPVTFVSPGFAKLNRAPQSASSLNPV